MEEPAPLRAASVGPERGCKAQASARACLSDRLAAPRSRLGVGGGGFLVAQVAAVVVRRLGLWLPLFLLYWRHQIPIGLAGSAIETVGADSIFLGVLSCPAVSEPNYRNSRPVRGV